MKTDDVVEGARLIEQLKKLDDFLQSAPVNSDTLTITFRDGKYSKSLSLRDDATITNIRQVVEEIREKTVDAILDLGIEI
jgi:hypothetical protein